MDVILWKDSKEIFRPKLKRMQTIDRIRQCNNGRINMTIAHLLKQTLGLLLDNGHPKFRVVFAQSRQYFWQQIRRNRRNDTNRHRVRKRRLMAVRARGQIIDLRKYALRPRQDVLTDRRNQNLLIITLKNLRI